MQSYFCLSVEDYTIKSSTLLHVGFPPFRELYEKDAHVGGSANTWCRGKLNYYKKSCKTTLEKNVIFLVKKHLTYFLSLLTYFRFFSIPRIYGLSLIHILWRDILYYS